ncbi:MAG: hypothetical protein JW937_09070 [Candidatus Omnitrophica bacterium]|nr:hypothetical protein [Candidatus Omnitrophota bacterium]
MWRHSRHSGPAKNKGGFLSCAGLSVMEVMVSTAILSGILIALAMIQVSGKDMYEIGQARADMQAQARNAIQRIGDDLRNATVTSAGIPSPNLQIAAAPPNNTGLTFSIPSDLDGNGLITDANGQLEWDTGNPITYQFLADTSQLVRRQGANTTVLANNVQSVEFFNFMMDSGLEREELRIDLTLVKTTGTQRVITYDYSTVIQVRN